MSVSYSLLLPELALAGLAFFVLALDWFLPRERKVWLPYLSAVGLLVVLGLALTLLGKEGTPYGGLLLVDGYAVLFKIVFLIMGVFIVLASADYVRRHLADPGEYYGLILLSTLAMMLMAAAGELLTAYISLELLSFSLYVLATYARSNPKSSEAGIKYILIGAFSSALLLYGLSLLFGVLGTTSYQGIAAALADGAGKGPAFVAALVLITAGLGFKIAAVPFHMWAPDVYEGAPTPITAYVAVASKAASFALLLRLFTVALGPALGTWQPVLVALAAVTMSVGNLVALTQKNMKRLLAYSSIGQAGYILMGVAAYTSLASSAVAFHIIGYAVTNLAAFICVIAIFNATGKEEIADYAGLGERSPFLALVLSVALFSLAGLPFFAGFTTKFYLFTAVGQAGYLWLVGLAVMMSLVSLYYYLMIVKQMYIHAPVDKTPFQPSWELRGALGLLLAGIVLFGVYPQPLVKAILAATRAILAG